MREPKVYTNGFLVPASVGLHPRLFLRFLHAALSSFDDRDMSDLVPLCGSDVSDALVQPSLLVWTMKKRSINDSTFPRRGG